RELIQRDLARYREVVVARQAHGRMLARELDARVGVATVADQVAQAPQLRGVAGCNCLERRLEGLAVGVDVGAHRILPRVAARPARAVLVLLRSGLRAAVLG